MHACIPYSSSQMITVKHTVSNANRGGCGWCQVATKYISVRVHVLNKLTSYTHCSIIFKTWMLPRTILGCLLESPFMISSYRVCQVQKAWYEPCSQAHTKLSKCIAQNLGRRLGIRLKTKAQISTTATLHMCEPHPLLEVQHFEKSWCASIKHEQFTFCLGQRVNCWDRDSKL